MSTPTVSLARASCRLCRSPLAQQATAAGHRYQSTAAATAASTSASTLDVPPPSGSGSQQSSTSSNPQESSSSSNTRIVAGILLSRAPLRTNPLTNFEREYYRYARKINRALGSRFDPEWYFRKGSQGYEGWKELVSAAEQSKEVLEEDASSNSSSQDEDVHSLARHPSRTLYLLAKKARKQHAWQFPQGGVEEGEKESLVQAAKRELLEEFGSDLDVWMTGKVPAAWVGYPLPKGEQRDGKDSTKVFFMPARVLRGTPQPNKAEGLQDYAWCTREEIMEKVGGEESDLWKAVKDVLSH